MRWWASGTPLRWARPTSARQTRMTLRQERNVESGAKEDHTNQTRVHQPSKSSPARSCTAQRLSDETDNFDCLVHRLASGHLTSPDRIISRAPGGIARKMLPSAR